MSVLSYQAEPEVRYLYQLVRDIAEGRVLLPRFRQPTAWTDDQQLELFRSVHAGTPIGSVVLWRTNCQDLKCYDTVGPHPLKQPSDRIRTYLLDGQQRLATLFAALNVPQHGMALAEKVACYDLEGDEFLFIPGDAPPWPTWLPLRFILDFPELLPFQRGLASSGIEAVVRRADRLVSAFGQYKIPVVTVVTNDVNQVTRTFRRIHSDGTAMSQIHMISALTWSPEFDLNERVALWKEQRLSPLGWEDLEDDAILSVCKAALGFEIHDGNVEAFSRALHASPEVIEAAGDVLLCAVQFLRDHCGIPAPSLLPYPSHIVALAEVIRQKPDRANGVDEAARKTFRQWFWRMAYMNRSEDLTKVLQMLEWMFAADKTGSGGPSIGHYLSPPAPLPKRFDFRAARCRTLALRLADLTDDEGYALLAEHGGKALPHLILDWPPGEKEALASPANRILVRPEAAPEVRRDIERACLASDWSVLDRHAIPPDAAAAFVAKDHEGFIAKRLRALEELENDFVRRLSLA